MGSIGGRENNRHYSFISKFMETLDNEVLGCILLSFPPIKKFLNGVERVI